MGNVQEKQHLIDEVRNDLKALQATIAIMNAAVNNPPKGADEEFMQTVNERLMGARKCEARALKTLRELNYQNDVKQKQS